MTAATCQICGVTVEPERPLDVIALFRAIAAHRCDVAEPWRFVPWHAVNCEDCGFVWPTGCHLTEAMMHACPPELGLPLGPDAICAECGDDHAAAGLPFCMDCLEANPALLP